MEKSHSYSVEIRWTGNTGRGTENYQSYERSHSIAVEGKMPLQASSDPAFRGDALKYNPEELLLASLSSCHMLWYLHLCAESGVVVLSYSDSATAIMMENSNGSGQFTEVCLHPQVLIEEAGMVEKAIQLHRKAGELCFIARSVNFPVLHKPDVRPKA